MANEEGSFKKQKQQKRPITTLFMLESLDGKISSGNTDELDADKDWCQIDGVKEGLHQYYEIESTTDDFSLNTGRVMAKIGVNDRNEYHNKVDISFVIIDNKPHLNENGIEYICNWVEKLILVTTNKNHIAYSLTDKYDNFYTAMQKAKINVSKELKEKIDTFFESLEKWRKEKSIEMIHVKDITNVTGYVRGGCSPLGMKKQYPTVIHKSALDYEEIYVSGGRIGTTLKVSPEKLGEAVNAEFEDVIVTA